MYETYFIKIGILESGIIYVQKTSSVRLYWQLKFKFSKKCLYIMCMYPHCTWCTHTCTQTLNVLILVRD